MQGCLVSKSSDGVDSAIGLPFYAEKNYPGAATTNAEKCLLKRDFKGFRGTRPSQQDCKIVRNKNSRECLVFEAVARRSGVEKDFMSEVVFFKALSPFLFGLGICPSAGVPR